jgi:hypothetical protein
MDNFNPSDTVDKQVVFVAMCFDSRLQTVYQKVVNPVLAVQNRPQKTRPLLLGSGLRAQNYLLVRERVVARLGECPPDDELVIQMIKRLGDSSWGVRKVVCEVLGRWEDTRAIYPLQGMLIDIGGQARLAATEAIERLYGKQATMS